MELLIACAQISEDFFEISMLQVNCFILTAVLFYGCQLWDLSSNYIDDIHVAWQKAIRRIFNLPYKTHIYVLPFVNRFNNFFDSLMSGDNKVIELLVHNCHYNDTPLRLNRKFMNMYNCNKCNKVEEAHGALLLSTLNVWRKIGLSLSFRKMRFNVWFMMSVSLDLDINSDVYLTFPCLTVLYE